MPFANHCTCVQLRETPQMYDDKGVACCSKIASGPVANSFLELSSNHAQRQLRAFEERAFPTSNEPFEVLTKTYHVKGLEGTSWRKGCR